MIRTLNELIRFINDSETVPTSQKRYLRSAVNRAKVLVVNGAEDVRLDPKTLLRQLDQISPAMADMLPQSYANLKSRVRQALRLVQPHLAPARSHRKLKGEWAAREALLSQRDKPLLSRCLRFFQGMGWLPDEIGEEHILRFAEYLEHEVMLAGHEKVVRDTRRAWNRAVDTVPGWPQQRLAPPRSKRSPYWLRLDQLPASLQQEIREYQNGIAHPDPFLGPGPEALAPSTLRQHEVLFITLASALVATGDVQVEELTSIASLVRPDRLKQALRFLYDRAGKRVNEQIYQIVYRVRRIAAHAGLPEADLARLDDILASIKRRYPAERGLTAKNRRLLEHLDDPAFVDRLVTLPSRLMQVAKRKTNRRHAASCAREAIAVELLLTCSMRLGNLVELRVGESIRRFSEGHEARWVIDIPAEKVKNRQPLRYVLLPETGQLIEWYLAHGHGYWCGSGSPWLFPKRRGGHVDPHFLSAQIARRTRQYVGVPITCHQFRHLAAELYLQQDPTGIGVVSQHLGHRKFDTTKTYYAREQTRVATQRYQEVLTRRRAKASSAARTRRRAAPVREAT
jgi:integrase